jgi:hypothetical protein
MKIDFRQRVKIKYWEGCAQVTILFSKFCIESDLVYSLNVNYFNLDPNNTVVLLRKKKLAQKMLLKYW